MTTVSLTPAVPGNPRATGPLGALREAVAAMLVAVFPCAGLTPASALADKPGAAADDHATRFYAGIRAVEFEQFAGVPEAQAAGRLSIVQSGDASMGRYIKIAPGTNGPVVLTWETDIPEAGVWRLHVRAAAGPDGGAFTLGATGVEVRCTAPANGSGFQWSSHTVKLPEASVVFRLSADGPATPDCLMLTRDARYVPDHRDLTGPLWMRFKVLSAVKGGIAVEVQANVAPYGGQPSPFAWLFRSRAVRDAGQAEQLRGDAANLLHTGEWSPWVECAQSAEYTWHHNVRFDCGGPFSNAPDILKDSPYDPESLRVAYQFATRADELRTLREGVETCSRGNPSQFSIIMPTDLNYYGWSGLQRMQTFTQWARDRYERLAWMTGSQRRGPRRIIAATAWDQPYNTEGMIWDLKSFQRMGLNTVPIHYPDSDLVARLRREYNIPWSFEHPWCYGATVGDVSGPLPGLNCEQTMEKRIFESADAYYTGKDHWHLRWLKDRPELGKPVRLVSLGDEIYAVMSADYVNGYYYNNVFVPQPFNRALFGEYLQGQGLKPEFFGVKAWTNNIALGAVPAPDAPVEARRAYYWTQRFRSYYTAFHYRNVTRAARKHFPDAWGISANLQAMPVRNNQMWDGELNIFDLGRLNAFDTLMIEDWHWAPGMAAFGTGLLRAAARKNGQKMAYYVVGHAPFARAMVGLGEGVRAFYFYTYGPVRRIGDAIGENPNSTKEISDFLAMVANCEDDLLASKRRQSDVGFLVANTSEIVGLGGANWDRGMINISLRSYHVPVEIVGEEEIVEDNALERYRMLVVVDPYVRAEAQKAIARWVNRGGTLLSSVTGLQGDEYRQPVESLQDVFGVKRRPGLPGATSAEVRIPSGGPLAPEAFQAPLPQSKCELGAGKALAAFADSQLALVCNTHGKGRAYLSVFKGDILAGRGAMLRAIAKEAGVRPHIRREADGPVAWVYDGPDQTVVVCGVVAATNSISLEVTTDRTPVKAYAATGRSVTMESVDGGVRLTMPCATWFTDVVVLRYKP